MSGVYSRNNTSLVGINFQWRKTNQWLDLMLVANFQKFWEKKERAKTYS